MDYNYHTHTYRCHHATGTPEEYIKRAISCGIKHMGYSEHIPFKLPGVEQSRFRMYIEEAGEYVREISALRDKYSDKIDIKIGFESEYYHEYFDKMLGFAKDVGAEYMILGQHFDMPEHLSDSSYVVSPSDSVERLKRHSDCIIDGIKSGAFSYVCHPDIANFTGEDEVYIKEIRRICEAALEFDTPLEINFLGIRRAKNYPSELFWRTAGEVGAPVVFGCDAHTPEDVYDEVSLVTAQTLVEKYHLNYIGKPKIRLLL